MFRLLISGNALILTLLFEFAFCFGQEQSGRFVVDFSEPMFANLSQEEKDIISEYAAMYPKVKRFYDSIRVDVNEKVYRDMTFDEDQGTSSGSPPVLLRENEITVRHNRQKKSEIYERSDRIGRFYLSDLPEVVQKNEQKFLSYSINIYTSTECIGLEKNDQDARYFSLVGKRKIEDCPGSAILEFDVAPCAVAGTYLEHVLFSSENSPFPARKDYIIDYVKRVTGADTEPYLEVKSSFKNIADTYFVFKLIKKNGLWVTKESEFHAVDNSSRKNWWRSFCEYDDSASSEIPLLKSYVKEGGGYSSDQKERLITRSVYEVTNLIPGPVDLSEFDVAQFLPPDTRVGEVMPASFSYFRIFLIVVGIVLLIIGAYMKIKKKT